jgi:YVTN family beta-propeller protein
MVVTGIRLASLCATGLLGAWLVAPLPTAGATAMSPAAGPAPVTAISVPGNPYGVAVDPATDTAYVTDRTADAVTVIDLATDTVTATIPVGEYPNTIDVDPATDVIYVTNATSHSVSVIDGATNAVVATIATSGEPNGVAVDAATDMVYVGVAEGSVAVINGATNAVTDTLTGPTGFPEALAVNPVTDTVYAGFQGLIDSVFVINGAANQITTVLESDPSKGIVVFPNAITVDPDTDMFYTADGDSVSEYSGADNGYVRTLSIDGDARGLADNPGADTVYAAVTIQSENASLIDGSDEAVTGEVPLTSVVQVASDPATDTLVATGANTVSVIQLDAPVLTSGNSATATVGTSGALLATATGTPVPTFSETGELPAGTSFNSSGALVGAPAVGTGGTYHVTITAANGVAPAASEPFTLNVVQAPRFNAVKNQTFVVGRQADLKVSSTGFPIPALTKQGHMPPGVYWYAYHNGNGRLIGAPEKSDKGKTYTVQITATNGVGKPAVVRFTIKVT